MRLFLWLAAIAVPVLAQQADLPTPLFQIAFPPSPADGASAINSLPDRANIVTSALACGNEFEFLARGTDSVGETVLEYAMAKMKWAESLDRPQPVRGQPPPPLPQGKLCQGEGKFSVPDVRNWFSDPTFWNQPRKSLPSGSPDLSQADLDDLARRFAAAISNNLHCSLEPGQDPRPDFTVALSAERDNVAIDPGLGVVAPSPYLIKAKFSVSQRCMIAQVNNIVPNWKVLGDAGTDHLTCVDLLDFNGRGGDWDVDVRDLTRLYYLNQQYGGMLTEDHRQYIRDQLLTLDRSPGLASYSVTQCGNAGDNHTGSPEQRADDNNWENDAVKSLGDALAWLLNRSIVEIAAGPALAALAATYPPIGLVLAAIAAAGVQEASTANIPETENHRLMMETSRYLNNLIIANEIGPDQADDAKKYSGYADEGRQWLLKRMQSILADDFIEYNARPYQRYSMIALYNLYDFTPDEKLREMARMVIEYSELKFALAGNQSRRTVPFRRRQEVTDGVYPMMDATAGADFQVSQMLFLSGQVQQLPLASDAPNQSSQVSHSAINEMVYLATSTYQPDPRAIDLEINKSPYYQRLAHSGGVEIYSGDSGYTISAGGFETDAAYSAIIGGTVIGNLNHQVDHGAGVPTALLLAAGSGDMSRLNLIRIEGDRVDHGSSGNADFPDWHNVSYNHNTCVWLGFACGVNVVVPPRLVSDACKPDNAPGADGGAWAFFNTSDCDSTAPKVYIAVYNRPCPPDDADCRTNQGFFEAAGKPAGDFSAFKTYVLAHNSRPFDSATASTGTYHSFSGHDIAFDCEAHQHDKSRWGISAVDGAAQPKLDDWPPAEGDIVTAHGDNHMTIRFPGGGSLSYDFSDWSNPVRTAQ